MKKLLSVLLVVAMVLGLATTAFAFTDVTATAQVGPAEKLAALGILKGYDDGTFKPENPITRAEFAAVIVRAMGLEAAAKLMNNPTKFKDVTANSAWAYGYINIASSKNIIKGDPDGKFRPNDKVSFAEAITMLLRAGGWDAACSQMDWPAGFVMKAVEFGLTDDVTFDANSPANRGSVAVMTYNALSMPMAKWNDTVKVYENDSVTLGAKFLNATEATVVVASTPAINPALKANQIVTSDGTMNVPAGTDVNALLGHEVRVIKTSSTDYVYVKDVQAADKTVTGTVKTAYNAGTNVLVVTVGSTDTNYSLTMGGSPLAVTATVIRNNVVSTAAGVAVNDKVTMFLDNNGAVRYIVAKAYTASQVLVTAKTTKGVNGATADTFTAGGVTYNVATNTVYTLNGATATFADVAVGQVVYLQDNAGTALVVDTYDTKVTGKVTNVGYNADGSSYITVNGTNYTVDAAAYTADCTLDGAPVTQATLGSLVNFDVTLKLNASGKARVVSGTSSAIIGKVTAIDTTDGTGYNGKITINFKGTATQYNYICNDPAVVVGGYVSMSQRADGKVTGITPFSLSANYTVKAVDTTTKTLTLENGGTLSIINYSDNAFGVRLGVWGDISLLKVGDVVNYDASPIKYFEVNPTLAGHVYGKWVGATTIETVPYVYIDVKGEVKSYVKNGVWANQTVGDIVDVTLNSLGEATNAVDLAFVQDGGADCVATVVAISGNSVTASYGASPTTYIVLDLSSAVLYSDAAGNPLETLSDLKVGDTFKYAVNGSTVAVVVEQ